MARDIQAMVVIRWAVNGDVDYHIADPDGRVAVVVVDERCPDDRCYELLHRDNPEAVSALAPMPWGHMQDDKHEQATVRVLRAKNGLSVVGVCPATSTPEIATPGKETA